MAIEFNGTTQYVKSASSPISAYPLTMACWFKPDDVTRSNVMMGMFDGGSNIWYAWYLAFGGAASPRPLGANQANNNVFVSANSTTDVVSGVWQHACAVYTSTSSRTVYLDGGNSATNTTLNNLGATVPDYLTAGAAVRSIADNYFDGMMADVAVWATDLSASDVAALAKGHSPANVRPDKLVAYYPLIREFIPIKGPELTTFNSPTVAVHPRVYS